VIPFAVRRLTADDLPRLRQFWNEQWSGGFIVTRGTIHKPEQVEGFIAGDEGEWAGLITYRITGDECEVISLDAVRKRQGIGMALLRRVIDEAGTRNCRRLFLITTNDNLYGLGFYQRRGFELVTIRRGALDETRKLKPGIPLIGENHIPLRDEFELEMSLRGGA